MSTSCACGGGRCAGAGAGRVNDSSGGGTEPSAVARGHQAFRELLETMHLSRVKRLERAGFTADQADIISKLHTPNFM
jgi:hypothetical protein